MPSRSFAIRRDPFWPLFWNRTLGLEVSPSHACFEGDPILAEACALEHPEYRTRSGPSTVRGFETPEQQELYLKLLIRSGRDAYLKDGNVWIKMPNRRPNPPPPISPGAR